MKLTTATGRGARMSAVTPMHNRYRALFYDAFSSREPGATSLENALNTCIPRMLRVSSVQTIRTGEAPMPARIIGMIGTQQEGVAVHLIQGKISREWVRDFTRLHEQWNYDSVLVGYYASAAEGFAIALYAADHTERIQFL